MLTLVIKGQELFDEEKEEFVTIDDVVVRLEHSLVALSKWESIHEKPFLDGKEKTSEETLSYIHCMVVDDNFPPEDLLRMSHENMQEITNYIEQSHTATWFSGLSNKTSSETITNELVYYWMMSLNVDLECENWHLNRLFTLLKVFSAKNEKPRKKTASEISEQNRMINERRLKELGTSG